MVDGLVGDGVLRAAAGGRPAVSIMPGDASGRAAAWPAASWLSRPSLLLEQRAALELVELYTSPVYYGVGVPRGDGSPVLLLPGFLGSDDYLSVLRGWLRQVGYRPYSSGLRFCAGSPFALLARVLRRAEEAAGAEGRRLTLVGHSLGGILSAVIARQRPDLVAHVVTLGSALCDDPRGASHPLVVTLADLLGWHGSRSTDVAMVRELERNLFTGPLPDGVRLTCIYTREDAVVDWRACVNDDPRTAAHEVRGTHSGLAWNAQVYRFLGRVLLQAPLAESGRDGRPTR